MKYILITGVSTGIGKAIAEYLISRGYFVFGSVRQEAVGQTLAKELGDKQFMPLVFDVRDDEAILQAEKIVRKTVGNAGLFALINNAGIAVGGPLKYLEKSELVKQFEVNVFGVVQVTQTFLNLLGADKNSPFPAGRIINMSSIAGTFTSPFFGPYSASKFALESLTDAMRRELLPAYGVQVVSIQPGAVETPIWNKGIDGIEKFKEGDYADSMKPLERYLERIQTKALKPIAISQIVEKALTAPNPKMRYLAAPSNFQVRLMRLLPTAWLDNAMQKMFRIKKWK